MLEHSRLLRKDNLKKFFKIVDFLNDIWYNIDNKKYKRRLQYERRIIKS